MVTTFYPPYHFGGDAIFAYNLTNALARRGHRVEVIHDVDAYRLARRSEPAPVFENHPNVIVHRLRSRWGWLSPLATQQTGRPLLQPRIRELLVNGDHDVVHFHNVSLIGPAVFRYGNGVKLMTLHEHWLVCPMHILWRFDREACARRTCLRCMLHGRRPPQWWRYTGFLDRQLAHVDQFISPSRFTRDMHAALGMRRPVAVLPYFVPGGGAEADESPPHRKPYFLFAGRLVKPKGLDRILPVFRDRAQADLIVAGDGDQAAALKQMARGLPNIRFVGPQSPERLRALYRHAIGVVVPSVCYEVLSLVPLEAFTQRTPVVARQLGGLSEVVEDSDGGLLFRDNAELAAALDRLQQDAAMRSRLGENGYRAWLAQWSEEPHLKAYFDLITAAAERRRPKT
jgi:glycosyltransferase involved in cell wall biosynthesis